MSGSTAFLRAFNVVMDAEGGLSMDEDDPGNWTGGKKDKGELLGTKYGISAAQYPQLDIPGLRREDALNIYWRDYWQPNQCELMPQPLGTMFFDACVNQGSQQATIALQRALRVKADGILGPVTIAASRAADPYHVCADFLTERAWQYTGTKNFQKFGKGWLRRLFDLYRDSGGIR